MGRSSGEHTKKSTIERIREEGKLPTASSLHSFSNPPNQDWNISSCFAEAKRMNHAASGSFLGTFYHEAEEHGMTFPGPGTYALDKSTMLSKETSCTRPSTLSRRSRTSCASMSNSLMTASLAGADQLLLPPGPDFQAPPLSDFDRACQNKDLLTASFASQTIRFIDPSKPNSSREIRKFEKKVHRRPQTSINYPVFKTSKWTPGMPHGTSSQNEYDDDLNDEEFFNNIDFEKFHNHNDSIQLSQPSGSSKPRRSSKTNLPKETPPETMGAAMATFSFSEKVPDLSHGFTPVDPYRQREEVMRSAPGRERQIVLNQRNGDMNAVRELEEFKPPNTTALRFY